MRPEPQPSCWPSASSSRACFASDPWPYVPPYGFAGSIFRRATMARVTRIATQSALRSDAITIILACDRPQTDKGIRRGARSGARLGHSGTAVCGRKGSRGRRIHDREPHCPGISGPATPWLWLYLHRSAATRPPDCAGWTCLRKFKGFRACDGARGRASRLCRVRGKERRIDRPRGRSHARTRALGGSRMGGAFSVSLLAFSRRRHLHAIPAGTTDRLCAVSEVSGASTEYRRSR